MTCGVTVVKYRGRGLLKFLEPFCKISGRFSNVFFITPMFTAFISINDSTFVCDRILVLGSHKEASDGLSSFKEHLNPKFVACPLYSLTKSLMVWDYHVQVCFVVVLASLGSSCFVLVWVLALHSCPFNGPCGVFASCESFEEVFFFFLQQLGVEQTVDALWYRVPATLYLDGIVWWVSHCRYKSVWVVFLNTDVFRLPSSSGVTRMSKKGIDPSSLTSSQVNLILGCIEFRCCRNLSLSFLMIVNVSSTNLFHRVGGVVDVLMAWTSISSMNKFATCGLIGEPIAAPSVCS